MCVWGGGGGMGEGDLRLDSQAVNFPRKNRLVKPRVVTCSTFATIFVATQVARPHAVTANMPTRL